MALQSAGAGIVWVLLCIAARFQTRWTISRFLWCECRILSRQKPARLPHGHGQSHRWWLVVSMDEAGLKRSGRSLELQPSTRSWESRQVIKKITSFQCNCALGRKEVCNEKKRKISKISWLDKAQQDCHLPFWGETVPSPPPGILVSITRTNASFWLYNFRSICVTD